MTPGALKADTWWELSFSPQFDDATMPLFTQFNVCIVFRDPVS